MKIFVTGGTGYVGSHSVASLMKDGHEIRMLVRSRENVYRALTPLGININQIEIIEGDINDLDKLKAAMKSVDSILHAASVVDISSNNKNISLKTNRQGFDNILNESIKASLDPIIHVSSGAAILPNCHNGVVNNHSLPTQNNIGPYQDSKTYQEKKARELQLLGFPIVITNPTLVMGPNDPHWGVCTKIIMQILMGNLNPVIEATVPIVDVRDLAQLHSKLMKSGNGPKRYLLSSNIQLTDLVDLINKLTYRNIKCYVMPRLFLNIVVVVLSYLQTVLPIKTFVSKSTFSIMKLNPYFDDTDTVERLKINKTDISKTIYDMLVWMKSTNKIPQELFGELR